MERILIASYLTIFMLVAVIAGCDTVDNEPIHIDTVPVQTEAELDLLFDDELGKISPEKIAQRNAHCSTNPNDSRCAKWCANPLSNCDGDPEPDPCEVDPTLPECNPEPDPCEVDPTLPECNPDPCEDGCEPPPDPGPNGIPTDRIDLGGNGWDNTLPAGTFAGCGSTRNCVIVFTGYSNSAQSANTFLGQFAGTFNGVTFVNCAQGGSALENWVNNNMAAGCASNVRNDVVLTTNMIATQNAMDEASSASTIASMLPQLDSDLKAQFPNAVHAYYGGEPAHFVEPSKCPRICEPIRKLASDWAGAAALSLGSYLGPYLWAGEFVANAHGYTWKITDFLNPSGGYANQHPSEAGRIKVAQQYDIWFRENGAS